MVSGGIMRILHLTIYQLDVLYNFLEDKLHDDDSDTEIFNIYQTVIEMRRHGSE